MKIKTLISSLALALGLVNAAVAAPVSTPLLSSDYVTIGSLDWAWAAPIDSQFWGSNVLEQAGFHAEWREATDAEWLTLPTAAAFNGTCASKYWNSEYTHCDYGNPFSQHWMVGNTGSYAELVYVRDAGGSVPEPATLSLLALAALGFSAARRRKQQ